ncbi:MAG: gliding motility-associated C-terminal domain-containing protein [Candidatus Poribacteria bacterium]
MIARHNLLTIVIIVSFLAFCLPVIGRSAVESTGEVNAKDNNAGTLIAGTQAELIANMIIDMSQAEPGEEIESIRIIVPNGLTVKAKPVKSVVIGEKNISNFTQQVQEGNQIIVTLPTLITLTSRVAIEFTVDVSAVPIPQLQFIIGLIAVNQRLLISSIKPGNADGRVNNDSLTLRSVSATKPLPPTDIKVQPDPNGENDLIITWSKVDEAGGYIIYRNNTEIANVIGKDQTSYTDRDLNPATYSYTIRSYKTDVLRSDMSASASGTATKDTKAPSPPTIVPELKILEKGIEVSWKPSSSTDVVKYIIYRGASASSTSKIGEVDATKTSYLDTQPPEKGSFLYIIGAIDEAGNQSKSSPTQIKQILSGDKPQPNPFTPKSSDPRFNQITFPSSLVKGGEGTFTVKIFDLEGNLVFEKDAESGSKEIKWDGKDSNGNYVNSGIYIYQATMGNQHKVGSIIVAK